jgi:hypothetical protein
LVKEAPNPLCSIHPHIPVAARHYKHMKAERRGIKKYRICGLGPYRGPSRMKAANSIDAAQRCLTATVRAVAHGALQRLDLGLELLDERVAALEILVEAVALRDELLLPLPEPLLLDLDLLGEALTKRLLLLLELGVVELPRAGLAKLPRLHLLRAVGLVVVLLGGVDQVEHVGPDEDGAELLEVAVVLVLDFGDTPRVLSALDGAAIVGLDIFLRANNGKWHGVDQAPGVVKSGVVVLL